MPSQVITRFAPSPTGFLHIGGARTALFNYLFAKHHGGKFLLRIEDTDRARSTEEAIEAILKGLDWLGLKADEEPIYQFVRSELHAKAAHDLVAKGGAYYCFMSKEETDAKRDEAIKENKSFIVNSPWRDAPPLPTQKI
jgi:glutamyl-tRNA synthetase